MSSTASSAKKTTGEEVSAFKRRRKLSRAEQVKAKRRAAKYRKRRKYRSPWKRSDKGMRGQVKTMSDGQAVVRKVRKKFYFDTYDAKGNHLGTFWFIRPKVENELIQQYKAANGFKHPAALPIKSEDQIKRLKK